eukprot:5186801-Prymnesium_polylepis.2
MQCRRLRNQCICFGAWRIRRVCTVGARQSLGVGLAARAAALSRPRHPGASASLLVQRGCRPTSNPSPRYEPSQAIRRLSLQ